MLLDIFDNIKIEQTDNISHEDKVFCERQEEIYNKLKDKYTSFMEELKEVSVMNDSICKDYTYTNGTQWTYNYDSPYYYSYKPIDISRQIIKMRDKFVSCLSYYFQRNYSVTIDNEKINKKFGENIEITYNDILDEIIEQLGGFSFSEKAEKEIKDKLKERTRSYYRDNTPRVKVAKNKITINDYCYFESRWGGGRSLHYNYNEYIEDLFRAFSYYQEKSTKMTEEYKAIYDSLRNKYEPDFELNNGMVTKLKFYQNRKVDIWFANSDMANQFAKDFLSL